MPDHLTHRFDLSIPDELDPTAKVRIPGIQAPARQRPSVRIWTEGKWAPAEYPVPRGPGRRPERPSARWARLAIRRNMRRSDTPEQSPRMILQVANQKDRNVEVVITRERGGLARISARHARD
jgi:hypothetical protein